MRDMNSVLSAGAVEARLAALLVNLADRFGDIDDDAVLRVPLVLTRSELASCISSTMETVIRTMSRWDSDGIVETYDQGFIIRSPDRLRHQADPLTIRARKVR
jgi:CRP-like cAMP-binding protein